MIGYFVGSGDTNVNGMITSYLWGPNGLAKLVKPLKKKNYGPALKLLLIEYYGEGEFSSAFNVPNVKVSNYSSKNRDISVKVPVKRIDFHDTDDLHKRKFLVQTTLEAIELVRVRLESKKLDVDMQRLRRDVEAIGEVFIAATPEAK
jgi:hypothetical protein